jgi:hypothetical protein
MYYNLGDEDNATTSSSLKIRIKRQSYFNASDEDDDDDGGGIDDDAY